MQHRAAPSTSRVRTAAVVAWVAVAIVVLLAVGTLVAPARASEATQLQTARDALANCMLLAANSTGDQKARADECIVDQTRVVELLTGPTPTPSSTSPTPSQPPVTPSTSPTVLPPSPNPGSWPNPSNTGVPAGWTPLTTRTGTWTITAPGTYADVRVQGGGIIVRATGVTLLRVSVEGGRIWAEASRCVNGLVLDRVTIKPAPGQQYLHVSDGAVGPGGYTARRVAVLDADEGFRVSGRSIGCGATSISDSFVRLRTEQGRDTHADGVQLYDGGALTVRNLTIDWGVPNGTTAFFAPGKDGNTGPVNLDRLLLKGGGYSFTAGVPGTVSNLKVVDRSWVYGPVDANCSRLTWGAGNEVVSIDAAYQPTRVRSLACG